MVTKYQGNAIFNSRKHLCCINQENNNYWNQVWLQIIRGKLFIIWLDEYISHVSKKFEYFFFQTLIVHVQKYNWTFIIEQSGTYTYQCTGFFQSDLFFHQLTKNTTYLNLPRNLPQSQFVYKTILGKSNVVIWINCQLIKEWFTFTMNNTNYMLNYIK